MVPGPEYVESGSVGCIRHEFRVAIPARVQDRGDVPAVLGKLVRKPGHSSGDESKFLLESKMKRAKMQALANFVVIEPLAKKDKTEGGIRLSDRSQKESDFCMVVSVGPLVKTVEVGDIVLNTGTGTAYTEDATGRKVYICEEGDVSVKLVEDFDVDQETPTEK